MVRFHSQHISRTLTNTPQKYIDNEEELQRVMEQLSDRLKEVNNILIDSDKHDIDVVNSSQKLTEYVTIYAESTVSLTPMFAGWW